MSSDASLLPPSGPAEPLTVLPVASPPHPGFWWSIVWCVAFIFATQVVPVLLIFTPILVVEVIRSPDRYLPKKPADEKADAANQATTAEQLQAELVEKTLPWVQAGAVVFFILFSWVTLRAIVGCDWKRCVALRRPSAAHLLLVLIGFPGIFFLGQGAYEAYRLVMPDPKKSGLPIDLDEILKSIGQWPWFFSLLVIAVGAGIGEELWFRGFLGRGLVGRYGVVAGVLLTSLWFGLIHMIPQQAAFAALMGVPLHFVYLATRSLWLPMLLHFLNNGLAVLSFSLNAAKEPNFPAVVQLVELQKKNPLLIYGAAALLAAAAGWALYRSRTRLVPASDGARAVWQPEHPGVELPPSGSGWVVTHPELGWRGWSLVVACGLALVAAGLLAARLA
jgi:hypothetical protein